MAFHKTFLIFISTLLAFSLASSQEITSDKDICQPQNYKQSAQAAIVELTKTAPDFAINGTLHQLTTIKMPDNKLAFSTLESCVELIYLAIDNLNMSVSITNLTSIDDQNTIKGLHCGAGSHIQTCIDGFDDLDHEVRDLVIKKLKNSTELTRNSLAIVSQINNSCSRLTTESKREEHWLSSKDRRRLQASAKANLVVAKDGSGNYRTITDALKAVPNHSNNRFVIYVKSGVYYEHVRIPRVKWNVLIYGDGMNNTVVSGNLNYVDGTPTFMTATFCKGFIARDMGFRNTAGAIKHQAVALLSAGDRAVFYKCLIDGYHDTLLVHTNRQIFLECKISGTVDFIFGDASVVIQNSVILAKRPLQAELNTLTAHRKPYLSCNTGIVIQKTAIQPAEDLTGTQTFLGRPWGSYSTVVFLENTMNNFIDPHGWLTSDGKVYGPPPPPNSVFFAEFQNKGPGAITTRRARWKGVYRWISYKVALNIKGKYPLICLLIANSINKSKKMEQVKLNSYTKSTTIYMLHHNHYTTPFYKGRKNKKMDMLWEDLNEELSKSLEKIPRNSDISSTGKEVHMSCVNVKALKLLKANGHMMGSGKKPSILVFVNVLKKAFVVHNSRCSSIKKRHA
ncbi:hypothetical protein ACJIZ3_019077 [Penstemon smallii]|uniref:Pectinesterase n=1 Tax=Penstemon smallii TaxID=265156 RepID=A0ABD3T123_9LAMI